jgi:hypothetical protein
VLPGQPARSILLYRMDSAEPGIAMPELGKAVWTRWRRGGAALDCGDEMNEVGLARASRAADGCW